MVRVVDMGTHTFVGSPVSGYMLDSSDCLDLVVEPEAFVTCTIVYTHIEPDIAIISPVANDTVTAGSVTIAAEYREDAEVIKDIDWTVFRGACDALGLPVAGNTAGFTDEGTLLGPSFFVNVSITEAGPYCVQIDPRDEAGTVFAEQNFSVVTEPVFVQDGYVRRDSEGDGIYSTVEAGLRNWTVYARQLDGSRSFVARTNASGYFKFLLPADRFVIAFDVPSNWTQTAVYSGSEKQESNTCTHFVGESATSSECGAFFFSVPQPSVGGGTKVTLKAPVGRVLGATTATSSVQTATSRAHRCESGLYLSSYMGFSGITAPATEVLKLQVFLNAVGLPVPMTMVYDGATRAAVRDFQNRYTAEILAPWGLTQGTGVVYTLTRWKINTMICAHAEPKPLVP